MISGKTHIPSQGSGPPLSAEPSPARPRPTQLMNTLCHTQYLPAPVQSQIFLNADRVMIWTTHGHARFDPLIPLCLLFRSFVVIKDHGCHHMWILDRGCPGMMIVAVMLAGWPMPSHAVAELMNTWHLQQTGYRTRYYSALQLHLCRGWRSACTMLRMYLYRYTQEVHNLLVATTLSATESSLGKLQQ